MPQPNLSSMSVDALLKLRDDINKILDRRANELRSQLSMLGVQRRGLNRPGSPEAIWFESRRHGRLFQHGVVAFLSFGRRDVADGLQEPPVVEPVHPFQRRELDGF